MEIGFWRPVSVNSLTFNRMQKLSDRGESSLEKDSDINSSSRVEEYYEADFTEVLNKYRVELVKKIDFNRQLILAHLQSKGVLDEEDCENIRGSATSRQQQVNCFLNILARKGRHSYHVFLEALELEDGELFELLTGKKSSKRKFVCFLLIYTNVTYKPRIKIDTKIHIHSNYSVWFCKAKKICWSPEKIATNSVSTSTKNCNGNPEIVERIHDLTWLFQVLCNKILGTFGENNNSKM